MTRSQLKCWGRVSENLPSCIRERLITEDRPNRVADASQRTCTKAPLPSGLRRARAQRLAESLTRLRPQREQEPALAQPKPHHHAWPKVVPSSLLVTHSSSSSSASFHQHFAIINSAFLSYPCPSFKAQPAVYHSQKLDTARHRNVFTPSQGYIHSNTFTMKFSAIFAAAAAAAVANAQG